MRKLNLFFLLISFFLFFSACSDPGKTVSLLGEWEFRRGFQKEWLTNGDGLSWEKAEVPVLVKNITALESWKGLVTFRKAIPEEVTAGIRSGQSYALNSGAVTSAADIYINDFPLGSVGSLDPFHHSNDRWLVRSISSRSIKPAEKNYIHVVLIVTDAIGEAGIKGPDMFLGKVDHVLGSYYRGAIVDFIFIAIYFFVGFYHMILGVRRFSEKHYIYFGIFSVLISFFLVANMSARGLVFGNQSDTLYFWFDKMPLIAMVPFFSFFISHLFHQRYTRVALGISAYSALLFCFAVIAQFFYISLSGYVLTGFFLSFFVCMIYILFETIREVIRKNMDAVILIAGLVIFFAGGVQSVLIAEGVIVGESVMQYAFMAFIIGIVVILANRFINVNRKTEKLNEELDFKLIEQEKQTMHLRDIHETVIDVTSTLSSSSEEMAAVSTSFSDNAQSQASSVEQMSASMEELMSGGEGMVEVVNTQTESLSSVTEKLNNAVEATRQAACEMADALTVKDYLNTTIQETDEGVNDAARAMESAVERFEEMRRVSEIINDIADQINLLSLNAAIEAARAGEAGRGFAVVADEIGKLADNTSENLKSIVSLFNASREEIINANTRIEAFRKTLNHMLENITRFSESIEQVASLISNTTAVTESAGEEINSVMESANTVQNSVHEQQVAVKEVTEALQGVNTISQAIASGAEELTGSIMEVTDSVERLRKILQAEG